MGEVSIRCLSPAHARPKQSKSSERNDINEVFRATNSDSELAVDLLDRSESAPCSGKPGIVDHFDNVEIASGGSEQWNAMTPCVDGVGSCFVVTELCFYDRR
jgi:hypothetical protein